MDRQYNSPGIERMEMGSESTAPQPRCETEIAVKRADFFFLPCSRRGEKICPQAAGGELCFMARAGLRVWIFLFVWFLQMERALFFFALFGFRTRVHGISIKIFIGDFSCDAGTRKTRVMAVFQ